MGYIKEPKGIDFIIKSEPLTNDERAAISEFIRQYKGKHASKKMKGITIKRKSRSVNKKIAASGAILKH